MKNAKSVPRTLQELKKEKSKTNWSRVLAEKEGSHKAMKPTPKTQG